eukprot:7034533-Ditylum_brightwellii.AAC.1
MHSWGRSPPTVERFEILFKIHHTDSYVEGVLSPGETYIRALIMYVAFLETYVLTAVSCLVLALLSPDLLRTLLPYRHVAHDSPPARRTLIFQEQRGKNNTKRVRRATQHDPVALPPFPNRRTSANLNHHGGLSTTSTAIAANPLPLYDTVPPIME